MANPAEILFNQLTEWSDKKTEAAATKRGLQKDGQNSDAWKKHRIAIQHLLNIEEVLQWAKADGKDVSVYEEHLPLWTAQIFAFPNGWFDGNSFSITKVSMNQLRGAKLQMDYLIPEFKPAGQEGFESFIKVAAFKVSQLGDEHEDLKNHALKILRHLKGCLDDIEIFGEFNIVNALSELKTILFALEKVADTEDNFFKNAKDGVWSFFKQGSAAALILLGVPIQGALEAGGEDFYREIVKPEIQHALDWAKDEEITWVAPKEIESGSSNEKSD